MGNAFFSTELALRALRSIAVEFSSDRFIKYGGMAQIFLPIESEESGVGACHY